MAIAPASITSSIVAAAGPGRIMEIPDIIPSAIDRDLVALDGDFRRLYPWKLQQTDQRLDRSTSEPFLPPNCIAQMGDQLPRPRPRRYAFAWHCCCLHVSPFLANDSRISLFSCFWLILFWLSSDPLQLFCFSGLLAFFPLENRAREPIFGPFGRNAPLIMPLSPFLFSVDIGATVIVAPGPRQCGARRILTETPRHRRDTAGILDHVAGFSC